MNFKSIDTTNHPSTTKDHATLNEAVHFAVDVLLNYVVEDGLELTFKARRHDYVVYIADNPVFFIQQTE